MTSDTTIFCIRAVLARKKLILIVTVLGFLASVAKVIIIPVSTYMAETMLVVTSPEISGELADLVPRALNPKVYSDLILSPVVLSEVLNDLAAESAFPGGGVPALDDFMKLLEANIETVDQTSRPITYSPIITLSAKATTEELARAIVAAWVTRATEAANQANFLRLATTTEVFSRESTRRRLELDAIRTKLMEEKSQFNLDLMKDENLKKQGILLSLMESRKTNEQRLASATVKLASIREKLQGEERIYTLYRAPSDDAYWIIQKDGAKNAPPSEIDRKGMMTENLNEIYLDLQRAERAALEDELDAKAHLETIDIQSKELSDEIQELSKTIAQHEMEQLRLDTDETLTEKIFRNVSLVKDLTATTSILVESATEAKISAVGLNPLTDTIAAKPSRWFGRKATVVIGTMLAFAASIAYTISLSFLNILLPRIWAQSV